MPTEKEHIQQAIHNIDVVAYLRKNDDFCDWTATVTFYTALHIVEAVFYRSKKHGNCKHGQRHEGREQILKHTTNYKNIWQHYRPLQSTSVIARYLHGDSTNATIFKKYMSPLKVYDILIKQHLGSLIKSASKFLTETEAKHIENKFKELLI
jgi:hypothetical protein